MRSLALLLLAISCLASRPAAAQPAPVTFLPGSTAARTRYQKEHLLVRIDTAERLLLQSGLLGETRQLSSARYTKIYRQPPERRRGICGWFGRTQPGADRPVTARNTVCDLGEFPGSGLHQLRFGQPDSAGRFSQVFNFFAFSGWSGDARPQDSQLSQPGGMAVADKALRRAYALLDSALRHTRQDTLGKKWDSLVEAAVGPAAGGHPAGYLQLPGKGGDFALVLAVDQPLSLLVLGPAAGVDPAAASQVLQGPLLGNLLALFKDSIFSTLTTATGKIIPVLQQAAIDTCVTTIQQATRPPPPSRYDAGFCRETLLQEQVNEPVAGATFRLARPSRRLRQLVLVFRLRSG